MTKYEIAAILEEIAFLLELKGENPFKAKAYSRAAEILKTLAEEPAALVAERRLDEVKALARPLPPRSKSLSRAGAVSSMWNCWSSFHAACWNSPASPA